MRHLDVEDDDRVVVLEKKSNGIGALVLGAAIGIGLALLFAPSPELRRVATSNGAPHAWRVVRRTRWRTRCAVRGTNWRKDWMASAKRSGRMAACARPWMPAEPPPPRPVASCRTGLRRPRQPIGRAHAWLVSSDGRPRRQVGRERIDSGRAALQPTLPAPARKRSRWRSVGWTLRDYAVRVWDNSGEDNVLFLAGGIAFNIILAAVPFVLLIVTVAMPACCRSWRIHLHSPTEVVAQFLDDLLPSHGAGSPVQSCCTNPEHAAFDRSV